MSSTEQTIPFTTRKTVNAGHTPAPWTDLDDGFGTARKIHGDASGPAIATIHSYSAGHGPVDGERDANARLIAAAPDLLALAHIVVEHFEASGITGPITMQARAAIAKASTPAEAI